MILLHRTCLLILGLMVCLTVGSKTALATEGGSSYYFPGASATFGVGVAPHPGFMMANQLIYYRGSAERAVLRGHVNLELESTAVYNFLAGFYTFKKPVLGGRLQLGAAVPVGTVDVKVGADTSLGSRNLSQSATNIGDSMASAALHWHKGKFHYKLVQSVFMPTGGYTKGNLANLSRNYWGFDTSLAITWLNAKTGTEISIMPGILFNTKNHATDYQSGNEFHVDFALNQFLKPNFAVGLHGYYYSQLTGDSGSGAILGNFQGQSLGFGPAILWMPKFGKGNLSVIAKWLRDVDQSKRMHGDYAQFTIGYKF